ncbi:MAG TPA: VWA domain-containing protein [Candidatus Angelobacter sp.]
MSCRSVAANLFLVLACLTFSSAQDQPSQGKQPEPSTVLKSTTRLVVVDVVATNSKGKPVFDLGIHDFKLLENGKDQEIRVFDFQKPGDQQPSGELSAAHPAPAAKLAANVFTNAPAYKHSSALNVVLLDSLNTANPRQAFAHDELQRFLEKFTPSGPVAIYILGGSLRLVQDFTDDPRMLTTAALRLDVKGSALLDNKTGGPPVVMPAIAGNPLDGALRGKEEESRNFSTLEQIEITFAALNSIARSLAAYPGRKNLIWISDGFPFYINPRSASESYSKTFGRQISATDNVLMNSQVAIYPVDAHAIQVISFDDIGIGKLSDLGVNAITGGSQALQFMSKDFNERLAVHSTMNDLAEQTGGEAFYNSNSIESALRQGLSDGSTYYTLGYYPQDKHWDGKFRKIEVKAARPGIKLRYRLGYYAVEPGALHGGPGLREAALQQAIDVNSPVSGGLQFRAAVIQPSEKTKNKLLVNFGIDPRAISFEKDKGGLWHASVECAVEAYSSKGKVKSEASTMNAALQPDAFAHVQQTFFPCQQALDLPPGTYRLRLGVVDNRTGLLGTANATATIPDTIAAAPAPE